MIFMTACCVIRISNRSPELVPVSPGVCALRNVLSCLATSISHFKTPAIAHHSHPLPFASPLSSAHRRRVESPSQLLCVCVPIPSAQRIPSNPLSTISHLPSCHTPSPRHPTLQRPRNGAVHDTSHCACVLSNYTYMYVTTARSATFN